MGTQLLRAATSVGANYRAACRAKSRADFIAKMGIVEEEADEARYWLELLLEVKLITQPHAQQLLEESDAILAMTVSSIRTARGNR
jgi:four helix bundle protein